MILKRKHKIRSQRHRVINSMLVSLLLIVLVMLPLDAQFRRVDISRLQLCFDTSGTNCIGTEVTATPGVYRLLTSTSASGTGGAPSGTLQADQGVAGSSTQAWYVQFTNTGISVTNTVSVNVTNTVPVNVTNPSLAVTQSGSWTMPVTQSGNWTLFNTLVSNAISIRCVDITGTAYVACGPTTVTTSPTGTQTVAGTLTGVTGTFTATPVGTTTITGTVSATSGTIGQITMPNLTVTSSTVGLITMPALTVTSGTVGNTVTTSPTGTQSMNLAQVLGGALSTANPVIGGGRGSTTIPAAVADAAAVAQRYSKYGDTIIQFAPIDMVVTGTIKPTTTAATQILAATGTSTQKYMIASIIACNLSGTIATEMDITDSSGTIAMIPWTATALNGEPRCYMHAFPDGWPTAANSTVSGKLTVANGTGVFVSIRAYKTGT